MRYIPESHCKAKQGPFIFGHCDLCHIDLFFQKLDVVQELRNICKILVRKGVMLPRQWHNLCFNCRLKQFLKASVYLAAIVKFGFFSMIWISTVIVNVIKSAASIVFSSKSIRVTILSLFTVRNSDWVYFQSFCFQIVARIGSICYNFFQ